MLPHLSKRHTSGFYGNRLILLMMTVVLMTSCATQFDVKSPIQAKSIQPRLMEKEYITFDGDALGYQKWIDKTGEPKTVMIGVHGISGHAGDYDNLGKHLLKSNPDTALYAAETRGQGMDPNQQRRGDIRRVKDWYRDLYTFTGLVRKLHPKAKIIWFGESMGSLIVMHAYDQTPPGEKKPDAMVISSPIVDVGAKLPSWKHGVARVAAALFPKLRISLESLSDGQQAVVTEDDIHEEQAAQNPWYIRRFTLRLLLTLGNMADTMGEPAATVGCPVLVLHGGKDIFTSEDSVKQFYSQFPDGLAKTRKYYPGSYHLLMYDHDREKIFNDLTKWLKNLK